MHFIETARSELVRDPRQISQEKLQSLLELSIRTSNSEKDPFKDDVICYLSGNHSETIFAVFQGCYPQMVPENAAQLETVLQKEIGQQFAQPGATRADPNQLLKSFEYFTLDYNVEWPLNLILTETNLMIYKVVFKHLFHLRFVERELYTFWMSFQQHREHKTGAFKILYVLTQKMINFVKTIQYNFFYEVIEEHWKTLMNDLKVESVS